MEGSLLCNLRIQIVLQRDWILNSTFKLTHQFSIKWKHLENFEM